MSYTSNERWEKQPQIFRADGWTGESILFTNVVSKWARTPPIRAKNSKNKWSEWLGRGKGEGDKGLMIFVPVGGTNRDLRSPFCPGLWLQSGPMGRGAFGPRLEAPTGTKGWSLVPICASNRDNRPLSPPRPASRWTRDKSPLWSRTQRQTCWSQC